MNFEKAFQLSTYLLLLTGVLAIFTADGLDVVTAMFYLAGLAVSWFLRPLRISSWCQAVIVAVLLAGSVISALELYGWGVSSIGLLLSLSLLKVATRSNARDYLQIYLLALALLLVAATYTPSLSYLAISIVFLYLSILAFVLFENRQGYQRNPGAAFSLVGNLSFALVITASILLLAIPIFLAFPRGSVGLLGTEKISVAGFSESVRLGKIGRVLDSQQVVMRVKLNRAIGSLPEDLKWRGMALDHFDGSTWTQSQGSNQRISPDSEGRFLLSRTRRQKEHLLEQVFLVEPFSDVIFASPGVIQISGLGSGRFRLWQDGNDGVSVQPKPGKPFRYFAHSDLHSREEKIGEIWNWGHQKSLLERYLQLPPVDRRIRVLAREITHQDESSIEKALRVEKYLREHFEYTVENPSGGSPDPLADFLFQTQAGHCEYFATAQAVILRTLAIPARVVNGFRRGEYNEWGSYFIVRASDAHSWVEAYFPGAGWLEFDPTPYAFPKDPQQVLRRFACLMDSVHVLWNEIVSFDRSKQAGFFQLVRGKLEASWARLSQSGRSLLELGRGRQCSVWDLIWTLRGPLIVGAFAILLLALLFAYRTRLNQLWRRRSHRGDATEVARDYYLEMLVLLREKGFVKSRFETPAEFGRRVSSKLGSDLPSQITDSYYETRFGGILLDSRQLNEVYTLLNQLRQRA